MSKPLKISFEVTDTFDRGDFRDLLKIIMFNPTSLCNGTNTNPIEIFIISNDDSTAYIQKVGAILSLDSQHVLVESFRINKVNAIQANNIDIHFDSDELTITMIEAIPTYGVLVRSILDGFKVQMKYITEFDNILKKMIREEEKGKEC